MTTITVIMVANTTDQNTPIHEGVYLVMHTSHTKRPPFMCVTRYTPRNIGVLSVHSLTVSIQWNSTDPDAGYPDPFGPSGKSVENPTKLTCLEITGYQIKYSTALWLVELQIRRARKV